MSLSASAADARAEALEISAQLVAGCCNIDPADHVPSILDIAETLAAWLLGTVRITKTLGPVLDQTTGQPTGTTIQGDNVQIHDNEKFALSVDTKDAKGFETADAITWSADDGGAVVALTVADDGRSCEVVAVAPGSAVITVTDGAAGLSATESVDVLVGGTATIGLVEGAVEPQ